MRLDHVSYAAEQDGLQATATRLGSLIGVEPVDGGYHPRFGTRNMVLPVAGGRYVEVVEALEHPAAEKEPFGQVVRARSRAGGGWLGWVVAVDDIAPVERRLGRGSVQGNRTRPDGVELRWRQIGVKGLQADPQLPFLVCWECDPAEHPGADGPADVRIESLQIAGDPDRVREWLDLPSDYEPSVDFSFVDPDGAPGLLAVEFVTPTGPVRV